MVTWGRLILTKPCGMDLLLKTCPPKLSILFQGKRVNRDMHGARNILIFLTFVIEGLLFKGAYPLNITKPLFGGFGVFK
jgi:hypothetical protein